MLSNIMNIIPSLCATGYYIHKFNKECVTGSQRQTLFMAENKEDVTLCKQEKVPIVCFKIKLKTDKDKIMNLAQKTYGSNISKPWKEENREISKWSDPVLTPDNTYRNIQTSTIKIL